MLFAFANPKGGVGKSTLAVHLAIWLGEKGRRTALVDADVQSSSSAWLKEASPETALFRLISHDDILEQLPKIQSEFDHVVVDGPAGLSEVTRTILCVADKAFLPCGPSAMDLRASYDAIRVVRQVQKIRKGPPTAVLVPNRLQSRNRLSKEFLETAKSLEIPTSRGIRFLQAYADAVGQGTVVWRMGPRAIEAATEIQLLFGEIVEDGFGIDIETANERSTQSG
jgi:chromosome partitioning protein